MSMPHLSGTAHHISDLHHRCLCLKFQTKHLFRLAFIYHWVLWGLWDGGPIFELYCIVIGFVALFSLSVGYWCLYRGVTSFEGQGGLSPLAQSANDSNVLFPTVSRLLRNLKLQFLIHTVLLHHFTHFPYLPSLKPPAFPLLLLLDRPIA